MTWKKLAVRFGIFFGTLISVHFVTGVPVTDFLLFALPVFAAVGLVLLIRGYFEKKQSNR